MCIMCCSATVYTENRGILPVFFVQVMRPTTERRFNLWRSRDPTGVAFLESPGTPSRDQSMVLSLGKKF